MIDIKNGIIKIDGHKKISIDLREIERLEADLDRYSDLALVRLPGIRAEFNSAWLRLQRYRAQLTSEKTRLENDLEVLVAELLFQMTDEKLEQLGHKRATQKVKDSLITMDPGIKSIKENLRRLRLVRDLVESKAKAFENAGKSIDMILMKAK